MKAILLSAGYGSRLGQLTKTIPKCLLRINGQPLLKIWLDKLSSEGFTDVLINSHYLNDQISVFLNNYKAKESNIKIQLTYEKTLLGTAGTVWSNRKFVGSENCIIVNADILSDINLNDLIMVHLSHDHLCTIVYYYQMDTDGCGLIKIDSNSIVTKFEEKPDVPFSNYVYGGIQVIRGELFKALPFQEIASSSYCGLDFGHDVFPKLEGSIFAYPIESFHIDIGSPERYREAKEIFIKQLESDQI